LINDQIIVLISIGYDHATSLLFLKKIPKPMSRELLVSFQIILVIDEVNSKTQGVARTPFEVVQQRPCKVSMYFHPIPSNQNPANNKRVKIINFKLWNN